MGVALPYIDRTDEFFKLVDEIARSQGIQRETGQNSAQANKLQAELNQFSAAIGTKIHQTQMKLHELGKLAKAKGIFNDKTQQIQELTYVIKTDIQNLNEQVEMLQSRVRGAGNQNTQRHADNMVETLKTRLLEVTKDFKDVLQVRTKTLEQQDQRRNIYSKASGGGGMKFTANAADPEAGGGGGGGGQAQAMQYHTSRAEAVQNVQRTIGELGQMFQKMAALVTQQEEMIQRIDHDVDETAQHMQEGQDHLLKYYHSISSNRWLILKVFGIIFFFIIFFIVFLA